MENPVWKVETKSAGGPVRLRCLRKDCAELASEHTSLEFGGEAKAGDKTVEMLLKACGARKITGNEHAQRRSPGVEPNGTLSLRGWKQEDPAQELRAATGLTGVPRPSKNNVRKASVVNCVKGPGRRHRVHTAECARCRLQHLAAGRS